MKQFCGSKVWWLRNDLFQSQVIYTLLGLIQSKVSECVTLEACFLLQVYNTFIIDIFVLYSKTTFSRCGHLYFSYLWERDIDKLCIKCGFNHLHCFCQAWLPATSMDICLPNASQPWLIIKGEGALGDKRNYFLLKLHVLITNSLKDIYCTRPANVMPS